MEKEIKQQLFPYFAYLYSQKLDPEKYGNKQSMEDWQKTLEENKEDIDTISNAAANLSDEDWEELAEQYEAESSSAKQGELEFAKKGAKLKMLKNQKKKCECGCKTSLKNGGSLCSCCGGSKEVITKHKNGGYISKFKSQSGGEVSNGQSQIGVAKYGSKVNKKRIVKGAKGLDTDETWDPNSKSTIAFNKDIENQRRDVEIQRKKENSIKIQKKAEADMARPTKEKRNFEIVPIKKKKEGGKVKNRIKSAQLGTKIEAGKLKPATTSEEKKKLLDKIKGQGNSNFKDVIKNIKK